VDERRDVVVVGGGLAGLTAAATAGSPGRSVLLLDGHPAADRATTDTVGRFRFNRGAHALYRAGAGSALLGRLGVRVSGARPPLAGALGRRGDDIGSLPTGPANLATTPLVSPRGKLRLARVLAGMRRWRPQALADRTAATWFDELGLHGDERGIVEMLARVATYVADLDIVSADVVAQQVRAAYTDGVDYLHGGWMTLRDGIARAGAERGVERVVGAATAVVPEGERVRVRFTVPAGTGGDGAAGAGEQTVLAGAVVVAAGLPDACAALLPTRPAAWAGLGPPLRIACLDLGLAEAPQATALFGVDRPLYLVRHSPPADLAPPGGAVVHAMRYLHAAEKPTAAAARAELEEHCRLAGIDPAAAEEVRYLHRMVACGALPTPGGGGLAGRPDVADTGHEGVFVAGDWLGRDGHLADAALATGEAAGRRAADRAGEAAGRGGRGATTLAGHG